MTTEIAARDFAHALGKRDEEEEEEEAEELEDVCLDLSVFDGDWILRLDWYCECPSCVNCVGILWLLLVD